MGDLTSYQKEKGIKTMIICEHEKLASDIVKSYLKSDLAQHQWTLFSSIGHTVNAMNGITLATDRQLDIIQDALSEYDKEGIIFLVNDITPVLSSKYKGIAWNLVARSVYDFFEELKPDATIEQATKLIKEGR